MTIGEVIKNLRLHKKMTRKNVAYATGYTIDYIKKLEQKDYTPSEEALRQLSRLYNCNLTKYNFVLKTFNSTKAYNDFIELRWHITNKDITKIEESFSLLKDDFDFQSYEPRQLIIYAEALISSVIHKNYTKSIELCLEGLKVDLPEFKLSIIDTTLFSDTSYSLLICLSAQYLYLGDFRTCKSIVNSIYNNFKNVVFNEKINLNHHTFHIKKIHIITTNNLADIYFSEKKYQSSLVLCEEGIELCRKYETNNTLELLYKLKVENLYFLNRFNEAQQSYNFFKYLCIFKKDLDLLSNSIKYFKQKYPKIII